MDSLGECPVWNPTHHKKKSPPDWFLERVAKWEEKQKKIVYEEERKKVFLQSRQIAIMRKGGTYSSFEP
jgi:hypothetical protein